MSGFGDADFDFAATTWGEVRSRVSGLQGRDIVLLRRGEVRRGFGQKTSLILFFLPLVDVDEVEPVDAFDDIEVKGGRIVDDVADCRSLATLFCCAASGRLGDEKDKSNDSTSSDGCRSCGFAGTGAVIREEVVPRCLVGDNDRRQVSKVVCVGTDESRMALDVAVSFVVLVLAFFTGSREGEGCAGESIRSNVSIDFGSGGVEGRSKIALVSAGSVFERCIGPLLLFGTPRGRSSRAGDNNFSRSGRGSGVAVRGLIGGEDNRSIVWLGKASASGDERAGIYATLSWALASAREALSPGFVTFAKASMRTCGCSLVALVRFVVVLAFGAAVSVC